MAAGSPDSVSRAERRRRREINGLLMLDKPSGMTSNTALLEVRRLFQAQKAGHTGTLDPMASGVLPICLGHTTKLSGLWLDSSKRYRATVQLGVQTTSGDADGESIATSDASGVTLDQLQTVVPRFIGSLSQVPPMLSAIKLGGQRLYALAREGIEVAREPRQVEITALTIESFEAGTFVMDVTCGKGTYIRTLAEDLAAAIGQKAHLTALRRLSVSADMPHELMTLGQLTERAWQGFEALDALLLPSITLLPELRQVTVDAAQCAELHFGRSVPAAGAAPGEAALIGEGGLLMGLGMVTDAGRIQPTRWFGGIR